jgi:hypothetical protein
MNQRQRKQRIRHGIKFLLSLPPIIGPATESTILHSGPTPEGGWNVQSYLNSEQGLRISLAFKLRALEQSHWKDEDITYFLYWLNQLMERLYQDGEMRPEQIRDAS